MAKIEWAKSKLKSGDIVSFTYKGRVRNVIVMECPNDVGRAGYFKTKDGKTRKFLHGIEIPMGSTKFKSTLERIIKKMGGTRLLTEFRGQKFYQINFGSELDDLMNPRAAYDKIKPDIEDLGIYKTYHWNKVKGISLTNGVINLEELINPRYEDDDENKL